MEIYHGSLEIISTPEIRISNRTLDYGPAFIQQQVTTKQKNGFYGIKRTKKNQIKATLMSMR